MVFGESPLNVLLSCQPVDGEAPDDDVVIAYCAVCPVVEGVNVTAFTVMLFCVLLASVRVETAAPAPLAMEMLKTFVLLPAPLVALTVKLNAPTVVGVPEIALVDGMSAKSLGKLSI